MSQKIFIPEIRIIPVGIYNEKWNMAADEYLMLNSQIPTLRFYQWEKPTLSFGKSNTNTDGLDFKVLKKFDIQAVIRKTGGKTVLHHHEITYSFTAKQESFNLGILACYQKISALLQRAFLSLGVSCQMKKINKRLQDSLICFKEISSYELTAGAKKLVGSAQKRQASRILQHGSILLDLDLDLWSSIWQIDSNLLEARITCLNHLLGKSINITNLIEKIGAEFQQEFSAKLVVSDFTNSEKQAIKQLCSNYSWEEYYN